MSNEMTDRPFLEVTDLKQWNYCPRVVFYRFCLPRIRPVTYSMEAGIAAHIDESAREERRSLRAYGLAEGERHFDLALRSSSLGLSGRIDLAIRVGTGKKAEGIVVDYKLSEERLGANIKVQLAAYGLLLAEAWDIPVRLAFVYRIPIHKAEAVALTPALLRQVRATLESIHATIQGEGMPAPTKQQGKCVSCEFRRFCNDVM
jgi:CRISPR-associated exonuclease Cas4